MKNPRGRMPSPKSGQIRVAWATERGDRPTHQFCWKGDPMMKRDINLIMSHFATTPTLTGETFLDELKARGYDMSTLRFSIDKLPEVEQTSSEAEQNPVPSYPFYQLPR